MAASLLGLGNTSLRSSREKRVLLNGRTRFLIRLDEEFALVYDPQGKAMLPINIQLNENTRATDVL